MWPKRAVPLKYIKQLERELAHKFSGPVVKYLLRKIKRKIHGTSKVSNQRRD